MSFRQCTVQKTAKVILGAEQVYFKPCLIFEIWCTYSFPNKVHGKLSGFLNDNGTEEASAATSMHEENYT